MQHEPAEQHTGELYARNVRHIDANCNGNVNRNADVYADGDIDVDINTDGDIDIDVNTDGDIDVDRNTDVDIDADQYTDGIADRYVNCDADGNSDGHTHTGSGIDPVCFDRL